MLLFQQKVISLISFLFDAVCQHIWIRWIWWMLTASSQYVYSGLLYPVIWCVLSSEFIESLNPWSTGLKLNHVSKGGYGWVYAKFIGDRDPFHKAFMNSWSEIKKKNTGRIQSMSHFCICHYSAYVVTFTELWHDSIFRINKGPTEFYMILIMSI